MKNLFIRNFRGIQKTNPNSDMISQGAIAAISCQNIELKNTQDGSNIGIYTMRGNKRIKDIGKTIVGQFESIQSGVHYWFIYATDETRGYLYNFDIATDNLELLDVELSKSLACNGITIAQGFDDWFVFTNGVDDYVAVCMAQKVPSERVKFLNATDAQNRQIRGLGLEVQDGRLVTFCKNTVYWSAQANIFDWISSDEEIITSPAYQEFDRDVSAIVYFNNSLVVFTDEYSVCFTGNPADALNFKRSGSTGGGTPSFKSVIKFDNKLFYYDHNAKNVFAYYLLDVGQTRPTNGLANNVIHYFEDIDVTRLNQIEFISYVYANKSELWFKFPTTQGNKILIFDYINAEWLERKAQEDICAFVKIKGSLYSAYKTKIVKEYTGSDFDGRFIPAEYKTSVINLNSDSNIKIPKMPLILTFDFNYENDFFIELIYDDKSEKSEHKHIVKLLKGYLVWSKDETDTNGGSWALNHDDTNGNNWVSSDKNSVMFNLDSIHHFKRLQIRFYTKEKAQEFGVKRLEFKKIRFKTKSLG